MSTKELIKRLEESWTILFPEIEAPDSSQWALWLLRHQDVVVKDSIAKLAVRYHRNPIEFTNRESVLKFASAIMNKSTREQLRQCREPLAGTER